MLALLLAAVLASTVGIVLTERSAVMFRVGTPGTLWKGPLPMLLGLIGPLVYGIPLTVLLVRATAALFGATPGQALLGIAIVPDDVPGSTRFSSRLLRFVLEHVEWIGFVLGLASGRWEVAAAGIAGGVARFLGRLAGRRFQDEWSGTRLARVAGDRTDGARDPLSR